MIEENQDTSIKGFLNQSLLEHSNRNLPGNQTVVHKNKILLSPFKMHLKVKHSNSESNVKSSSFKTSFQLPLVSKYAKQKSFSPNNPELMISKKPLEEKQENDKQMIMSKLASKQ
jgi:hypothetical protein